MQIADLIMWKQWIDKNSTAFLTYNPFIIAADSFPAISDYGGAVFYGDVFYNQHGSITIYDDNTRVQKIITETLLINADKYARMYAAIKAEYDPLDEYNYIETKQYSGIDTRTDGGTDTTSHGGTDTSTVLSDTASNVNELTTYDSNAYNPISKNTSNGSSNATYQHGETISVQHGKTEAVQHGQKIETTRTGRNTAAADLVDKQMSAARYSLQTEIINDILSAVTIPVYL